MHVPAMVEYLTVNYGFFDSIETEKDPLRDGIRFTARRGDFKYSDLMAYHGLTDNEMKLWLAEFIQVFDSRYNDYKNRTVVLSARYNPIFSPEYVEKMNKSIKEAWSNMNPYLTLNPRIKKVVFNNPATIVLWTDGTKTVVKCQNDEIFDPEKGLAMAIAKKAFGNKGNYCNEIKKWTEKYEADKAAEIKLDIKCSNEVTDAVRRAQEAIRNAFGIKPSEG